jgi:hypothetical protein
VRGKGGNSNLITPHAPRLVLPSRAPSALKRNPSMKSMLFRRRTIDTLRSTIESLGLLGSLNLCLDAGDPQSYPGSGDTWYDRSGQGHTGISRCQ